MEACEEQNKLKYYYSQTSQYGHLLFSDSFQCPEKILKYFLLKKPL